MARLLEALRIIRNPNPRAPLVAMVEFHPPCPVATTLVIDDGRRKRTITCRTGQDPARGLPIIGLRADTEIRVSVTARDGSGAEIGEHTSNSSH